jgi:hypothetical protein
MNKFLQPARNIRQFAPSANAVAGRVGANCPGRLEHLSVPDKTDKTKSLAPQRLTTDPETEVRTNPKIPRALRTVRPRPIVSAVTKPSAATRAKEQNVGISLRSAELTAAAARCKPVRGARGLHFSRKRTLLLPDPCLMTTAAARRYNSRNRARSRCGCLSPLLATHAQSQAYRSSRPWPRSRKK